MSEAALKLSALEAEKREVEDQVHALRKQLTVAESALSRSKTVIANLEAKAKRAQDAERAALQRVAELEHASAVHQDSGDLEQDFELWQQTAQCVVASYKQRLIDERQEADERYDIIRAASLPRARQPTAAAPAVDERETNRLKAEIGRLKLSLADAASRTPVMSDPNTRGEVVALTAKLDATNREVASLKETSKRLRSKNRDLEDELATLYRKGIAAREAMLLELSAKEASAQRAISDERQRGETMREAQIAKLQHRIAELENEVRAQNTRAVEPSRDVTPVHNYRRGLVSITPR